MTRTFISRLPFRVVIAVPFTLLIILAVGLTGYLSYRNGQSAVNHLADDLHREAIARTKLVLDGYLSTPILVNKINLDAVRLNILDTQNVTIDEDYLLTQLERFKTIVSIAYADEQRDYIGPVRELLGADLVIGISTAQTGHALEGFSLTPTGERLFLSSASDYDPRNRPWYQTAVQAGHLVWTPIYLWSSGDMGIDAVAPVFGANNELIGVLSASLTLDAISEYLQSIQVSEHGITFIVERSGLLVASSTDQEPIVRDGLNFERLPVQEVENPVMKASVMALEQQAGALDLITQAVPFRFRAAGEEYFAQADPYMDAYGLDWLVVTLLPFSDFMSPIEASNRQTGMLIFASILGSVLIAGVITLRATRSIVHLNETARSLAKGDWDQRVNIDRPDEIGELANSFNYMAEQLHSLVLSIRASERRYQALFEDSPVSLWELDGLALKKHLDELRESGITDWPSFFKEHPDEIQSSAAMIKIIDVNRATMELMGADTKDVFSDGLLPFFTGETLTMFNHLLVELGHQENPFFEADTVSETLAGEKIIVHFIFNVLSGYENTWARLLLSLDDITDRVKAEEALRESEALYRQAIEAAGGVPYRQLYSGPDQKARFEFVGEGILQITGYSRETLDASLWQSLVREVHFIDELGRYTLDEAVRKVRSGEIPIWRCEYLIQARDESLRWVSDSAVELRDEKGVSHGSIGLLQDITKRKRAEEELQESQYRFSVLSEATFEGIVITDIGQIIDVNEQMPEMLGYTRSEMIGHIVEDFIAPESMEGIVAYIQSKSEQPFELIAVRKDGTRFPAEIRARTLSYKDTIVRVTAVRDISERKQAEETIREKSAELERFFTSALDLLCIASTEGALLRLNHEWEHVLGYRMEDLEGRNLLDFVHPDDQQSTIESIVKLKAQMEVLDFTNRYRCEDGSYRWIEWRSIPYGDLIYATARDVTERVQAAERMRELARHLVAAQEEERKHIAQELHDELGQALTAISLDLGSIENILPAEMSPDIKDRLSDARALANEVDERISELALDLRPSLLDDLGLLPTLQWYLNRFSQRLGIEVEMDFQGLEDRMPDEVETTLYRVIQEALTNVARHAQASRVRISLIRGPNEVTAHIQDDGQGFEMKKSQGASGYPGSLGLIGINDRISTLGGSVEIRSEPGQGVHIQLILPL